MTKYELEDRVSALNILTGKPLRMVKGHFFIEFNHSLARLCMVHDDNNAVVYPLGSGFVTKSVLGKMMHAFSTGYREGEQNV
jgi:hypothetical protein